MSADPAFGFDEGPYPHPRADDAPVKPLPPDAAALVEACEARVAKATPGLWDAIRGHQGRFYIQAPGLRVYYCERADDAAFIAHARADIPALCALVRAQQGEIGRLTGERNRAEDALANVSLELRISREAHQQTAVDRDEREHSHAIERAGLEGDKAQLAVDLDAARERAHGLANKAAIAIQTAANLEATIAEVRARLQRVESAARLAGVEI